MLPALALGALVPIASQALAQSPNSMVRLLPSQADTNGDGRSEAFILYLAQVQDVPNLVDPNIVNPDPLSYVSGLRTFDLDMGTLIAIFAGQRLDDFFGFDSVNAGDVDGDGADDLFVGSPLAGGGAPDTEPGKVELLSGATGQTLWSFDGQPGEKLGVELTSIGDVNGDGVPDMAAASIQSDHNGSESGRVYVLSGTNGTLLHLIEGADAFGAFGFSLAGVGDVDSDGVHDLAVGQPFDPNADPNALGTVSLVSGATGLIIVSAGSPDPAAGDSYGNSVVAMGDVSGDGVGDLVVTAPGRDNGRAYIVSGADLSMIRELHGSVSPSEPFALDASVRTINTDAASKVEIVSVQQFPGSDPIARGWIFDVQTGDLLYIEDDNSQGMAPLNADVNADGIVDMIDVALIPPHTVTVDNSRLDATRDGLVDSADLAYILSRMNKLSPMAPSAVMSSCTDSDPDVPKPCQCHDLAGLDLSMPGGSPDVQACPQGGGSTGGGGSSTPDWAGFNSCKGVCDSVARANRHVAVRTFNVRNWLCAAAGVGAGLFQAWRRKDPRGPALAAQAACLLAALADFATTFQNIQFTQNSCIGACAIANHVPDPFQP